MNRKFLKTYLDKLGMNYFSCSVANDVLLEAEKDGVQELVMNKGEYQIIKHYLLGTGIASWNWDKQTVWGIKLVVED